MTNKEKRKAARDQFIEENGIIFLDNVSMNISKGDIYGFL